MEFDLSIEHILQRQIIEKLTYTQTLRFSELKPKNIESNLFMYHLKQLMRLGLLEKTEGGYRLTPIGLAHVDKLNLQTFKHRVQAKIVTILAIEHEDGRWLLLERQHQPYIGASGFPSGKVHYGEGFHASAVRELQERANLTDIKLQLKGTVNFIFTGSDVVISNILGNVFYGRTNTKAGAHEERGNKTYWGDPSQNSEKHIPGFSEILEALNRKSNELFFLEKTFTVDHLLQ